MSAQPESPDSRGNRSTVPRRTAFPSNRAHEVAIGHGDGEVDFIRAAACDRERPRPGSGERRGLALQLLALNPVAPGVRARDLGRGGGLGLRSLRGRGGRRRSRDKGSGGALGWWRGIGARARSHEEGGGDKDGATARRVHEAAMVHDGRRVPRRRGDPDRLIGTSICPLRRPRPAPSSRPQRFTSRATLWCPRGASPGRRGSAPRHARSSARAACRAGTPPRTGPRTPRARRRRRPWACAARRFGSMCRFREVWPLQHRRAVQGPRSPKSTAWHAFLLSSCGSRLTATAREGYRRPLALVTALVHHLPIRDWG